MSRNKSDLAASGSEPAINDSRFSGPQESPGFLFWSGFMDWQRGLNRKLLPFGTTQPQFAILALVAWLQKESEEVNQQMIADVAKIDRMLVSQIITNLAQKKLVERSAGALDKRANRLSLTAEGDSLLAACLPVVEAYDSKFFAEPVAESK